LSGPIAVGKTAVADALTRLFGFRKISSSQHLRRLAAARGLPDTRETLQRLGDALDEGTNFSWLVDEVATSQVAADPSQREWFVDAVRKPEQVKHFRATFDSLLHVHLTAPEEVIKGRFERRSRQGDNATDAGSYEKAIAHPNEQASRSLGAIADLTIDLGEDSSADAARHIANQDRGRAPCTE
jgi:adenylosuccinate synthase